MMTSPGAIQANICIAFATQCRLEDLAVVLAGQLSRCPQANYSGRHLLETFNHFDSSWL